MVLDLLKTYLGYSTIEIFTPPPNDPIWRGVELFFLTILVITYEHINLQDATFN